MKARTVFMHIAELKEKLNIFVVFILLFILSVNSVNADILIINNQTTNAFTSSVNLNGSSWSGQGGGSLRLNKNASYLNGLIGSYNLDESTGTTIHNVNSEYGFINATNAGSWVGYTTVNITNGVIGNAGLFDGVDDYVSIPNWDSIGWGVPGGFTNTGIAYDITDNTLWIGDFDNSRIVHTYKNGTYIDMFNVGCNPGAGLQGVTINATNNTLLYSCFDTYKVGEVTKTGTELKSYTVGSANNINHIALNNNSTVLYVVRNSANITKHYASNGTQFEYFNVTGYSNFDGISYDFSDNTIWLTKDPSTIIHVDLFGAVLSVFTMSFNSLEGISANNTEGTLYLGSDALYHEGIANGNRVYNISKTGIVLENTTQFTNNITISAWIKPTNVSNVNKGIVAKRTGTANSWQLILGSGSKPSFRVYNATNFGEVVSNYPTTNTSQWYHIVATYNGSKILVYINGVQNNSGNYLGGNLNYSSSIIQIGTFFSATGNNFNGSIDEVNIWNRTLSASEISVLYNTSLRNHAMPVISNPNTARINRVKALFSGGDSNNNLSLYSRQNGTSAWTLVQSNATNNTWYDIPTENQSSSMDFGIEMFGNGNNTVFFTSLELDQEVITPSHLELQQNDLADTFGIAMLMMGILIVAILGFMAISAILSGNFDFVQLVEISVAIGVIVVIGAIVIFMMNLVFNL